MVVLIAAKGDIQHLSVVFPDIGRGGAQREVNRKKTGEKHHLASQPHNGAHGDDVWVGSRWALKSWG